MLNMLNLVGNEEERQKSNIVDNICIFMCIILFDFTRKIPTNITLYYVVFIKWSYTPILFI